MAGEPNLAMAVVSPEDLELFQRVMRTMQLLQSRTSADPPLAPRNCPALRSPYMDNLPDAVDSEGYDEDEETDDELEYDEDISNGDIEDLDTDDYESESSHGQETSVDEDKVVSSGHSQYNGCTNVEVGTRQDSVWQYHQMDDDCDSSDSGDTFIYPDESPPPYSRPQATSIPCQPPIDPFPTAPLSPVKDVTLKPPPAAQEEDDGDGDNDEDGDLRCWKHGCNGRKFTTRSNLRRHLREKSHARPACCCPHCGAVFSRTTARNTHVARGSCGRIRRYSNGRIRPHLRVNETTL